MIVAILLLNLLMTIGGCMARTQQEFCYERVILTLTVEASDAAKISEHIFTPADFPEVPLSKVVMIGWGPDINLSKQLGYREFLLLTLENPGRRNVLRAVDLLNQRIDVYRASLNDFATIYV